MLGDVKRQIDVLVIGGGSAGMAAAIAAYEEGCRNILILERSERLGGILCQCIHNGFGLHRYKEELTGPEYAKRSIDIIEEKQIAYMLNTFVIDISSDKVVTAIGPEEGLIKLQAKAIVLAMGCRERARGALMIPGTRPAGVITAGAAQKYLNLEGYLPGKEIVILGSGDIGLIMARQFTLEGLKVKEVIELMPYSGGLARNISQCLNDFDIPLSFSSTIIEIRGKDRVSSVVVAKVDENRKAIPGTERVIECDTLMISAGLIPENELSKAAGVELTMSTKGAIVDEYLQTSVPGIFACGNVLHVHDLVDNVSAESDEAGRYAAMYVFDKLKGSNFNQEIPVKNGYGVNALVPQYINRDSVESRNKLMFRPTNIYKNAKVKVYADDKCIAEKKMMVLTPGEMCELHVKHEDICQAQEVKVEVETS